MLTFSLKQAQKIILVHQKLYDNQSKNVDDKVFATVNHLGYIQLDSISVINRAHHHTLYNRVTGYNQDALSRAMKNKTIFEYWSHAASVLPINAYRFSLPRKAAIKAGDQHWFKPDKKAMKNVLAEISEKGPLMARDFKQNKSSHDGWWDWKPSKIALEQLYMQGDLMVSERQEFQKVYDLTERVLPDDIDRTMPSLNEYCEYLITQYLLANGLGEASHFGYLLKGMKSPLKACVNQLVEQGKLVRIHIDAQQNSLNKKVYFALSNVESALNKRISQSQVKILSPFDNLLIQRQRMVDLFDFNYQLECYMPASKRQFGYFSLPVLQGQRFVGRIDIKVLRSENLMLVKHLYLQTKKIDELLQPFASSLTDFMMFCHCEKLEIQKITSEGNFITSCSTAAFKHQLLVICHRIQS